MFPVKQILKAAVHKQEQWRGVAKPGLHFGDTADNRRLVAHLPQLTQKFRPTPWLYNTHLQLVFLGVRKKASKPLNYDHIDTLTMADGGKTALTWLGYDLPATTQTIVVLHTITGSPHSMQELVQDLHQLTGWRVVLCVRRGHADLALQTPRMNILGSIEDLREQLQLIQQRFPDSPLYGVGSSAGSGLLVRYLGEEGEKAVFKAGFAYCPGYNTDEAFGKAHPVYSRLMAKKLVRQFITPNLAQIGHLPSVPRLEAANNLAEFYDHIYELAGHDDRTAYSKASNPMHVFEGISKPLMILNSEDDPVCKIENAWPHLELIKRKTNMVLVTTARGSHCAHYEGWSAKSWASRLMANYFLAMAQQEAQA